MLTDSTREYLRRIVGLYDKKIIITRASEQGLTYTPGQCHRLIHKIVFKI